MRVSWAEFWIWSDSDLIFPPVVAGSLGRWMLFDPKILGLGCEGDHDARLAAGAMIG